MSSVQESILLLKVPETMLTEQQGANNTDADIREITTKTKIWVSLSHFGIKKTLLSHVYQSAEVYHL